MVVQSMFIWYAPTLEFMHPAFLFAKLHPFPTQTHVMCASKIITGLYQLWLRTAVCKHCAI